MSLTIKKSIAKGSLVVPPSKSYAHRLLIAGALSNGITNIENVELSQDILATLNNLKYFNKDINFLNKVVTINQSEKVFKEPVFDCLESGSTLRFLIPLALSQYPCCRFIGSKRLIERGIGPYLDICKKQNINVVIRENEMIFEGYLKADHFKLPGNISSQFISGLLFVAPLLKEDSIIEVTTPLESKNYIDITLDVLNRFGIKVDVYENKYFIKGNQKYISRNDLVEGDYSNSAFIDALNYLGGNVELIGLNKNSLQGDKAYIELFKKLDNGFCEIDISNCIDLGPILFCMASLKHGARFIKTNRLKIKESDRIQDLKSELLKFGVKVKEQEDIVVIDNSNLHEPQDILDGKNDHRIVMALSVMLTKFGGTIQGVSAVNKSYPNFFNDLKKINIEVIENDQY